MLHFRLNEKIRVSEMVELTDTAFNCYFCQQLDDEIKLKRFNEKTWTSVMSAAAVRNRLSSDKHRSVTLALLQDHFSSNYLYHSHCLKSFTAVKRSRSLDSTNDMPTCSTTEKKNARK